MVSDQMEVVFTQQCPVTAGFVGAHLVVHLEPSPTARNMLRSKQVPTMNVHMLKSELCFQLLHTLAILSKAVNNSGGIIAKDQGVAWIQHPD